MKLIPEVAEKVNRPFRDKLSETSAIIQKRLALTNKQMAVAWSGGKDSTLVLWFIKLVYPDIPVIFNNTGVEYPETVKFVHRLANEWGLNLIETKPIKTFWQCAEEFGFTKSKHAEGGSHCCYYCKEKPMLNAVRSLGVIGYFTGITAVENRNRMFHARRGTCYKTIKEGLWKIHPILWWTEDEVKTYIEKEAIPINPIYKMIPRCGCQPCTAFKTWEAQLSMMNPKMYAYIKKMKDQQTVMIGVL